MNPYDLAAIVPALFGIALGTLAIVQALQIRKMRRALENNIAGFDLEISHLYGECPLQSDGTINGHPFYFRARGNRWYFEVYDENRQTIWRYEEHYGDYPYAAGWMTKTEGEAFITQATKKFLKEKDV